MPRGYEIPIAITCTAAEPEKGKFRRLGHDVAVNASWLAMKWALDDDNKEAEHAPEKLMLDWPFDFHLFEWAKKVSKKNVSKETSAKIHEKAQPFIKWLKEAEEESESDDDEIEVDFDTRAHVSR